MTISHSRITFSELLMGFSERDNEVLTKITKKLPNTIALFLDGSFLLYIP